MGGFGAYEVLRRRFCINGRKALAAFVEPGAHANLSLDRTLILDTVLIRTTARTIISRELSPL